MDNIKTKDFKTIDEQIDILNQRGLIIPNLEQARCYLLTNNYYNIINGYSKPFLKSKDRYIDKSTFDEVINLYFFDKQIKQCLFNAIIDIEHHLKSIFAYRFSEAHSKNPRYAYLNIDSYDKNKTLKVSFIISKISKLINRELRKESDNPIKHYVKKYNDVPTWVITDYLDFGDLQSIIENVPDEIKNKMALDLTSFIKDNNPSFDSVFTGEMMISFIKNIREIRNICAHNNRLLYFNCRSDLMYFPFLHDKYKIKNDDPKRDTYSVFLSMQCFLSRTEYAKLHNTIRKRMRTLSNHLNSIELNDVIKLLGFPNDWQDTPKLDQP